jgi:hypothetical protein
MTRDEPWLVNPLTGAEELLRFSRVRNSFADLRTVQGALKERILAMQHRPV